MEPAASFQKVGRYELIRKIATGGMAELFVARFTGPGGFEKRCALKRILPQFTEDQEFSRMFLNEARIAALFDHPNIAQVFDFGVDESNGQLFMAMELINGVDLRHVLRLVRERGVRCPPELAAYIVAQALDGLAYAHGFHDDSGRPLNLVHRDVSPQNILVSFEGAVKLVDFGIVKSGISEHQTQSGMLKGKIAYMSPEQASGEPLDPRTDVFATGVCLYELITGVRPFRAATEILTLRSILEQDPQPITDFVPDCPIPIENATYRALAKQPAQRYSSAREFQRELLGVLRACPVAIDRHVLSNFVRSLTESQTVSFDATGLRLGRGDRSEPTPFAGGGVPMSADEQWRAEAARAFELALGGAAPAPTPSLLAPAPPGLTVPGVDGRFGTPSPAVTGPPDATPLPAAVGSMPHAATPGLVGLGLNTVGPAPLAGGSAGLTPQGAALVNDLVAPAPRSLTGGRPYDAASPLAPTIGAGSTDSGVFTREALEDVERATRRRHAGAVVGGLALVFAGVMAWGLFAPELRREVAPLDDMAAHEAPARAAPPSGPAAGSPTVTPTPTEGSGAGPAAETRPAPGAPIPVPDEPDGAADDTRPLMTRREARRATRDAREAPAGTARRDKDKARGRLSLNTMPRGLEVRVGDRVLGKTPLDEVPLAPGRHLLTLADAKLGISRTLEVEIAASETTRRTLQLERGKLRVNARPWADVFVDGVAVGKTPLEHPVYEGRHEVRLVNPELGERLQTVNVGPNDTKDIKVKF
jgi:serine/threonine protein kinase